MSRILDAEEVRTEMRLAFDGNPRYIGSAQAILDSHEALRVALRTYGQHTAGCEIRHRGWTMYYAGETNARFVPKDAPCSCGLATALGGAAE